MSSPEERDALEREMEQTRQRLAGTIDQLVHRSSPKTIAKRQVSSVRGYFLDDRGAPRTDNIVKVVGAVVGGIVVLVVVRKIVR